MTDLGYIPKGDSLVIVGMGETCRYLPHFYDENLQRRPNATDIWAINAAGWWFHDIDLILSMDDLERDGKFAPDYVYALLGRGGPECDVNPQVMSCARSVIGSIAYPLQAVCDYIGPVTGYRYLQNSLNYAFALGMTMGFKRISLLGCEWSAPDNDNLGEHEGDWPTDGRGRPYLTPQEWPDWAKYCSQEALRHRYAREPGEWPMALLLGIAYARGIRVDIPVDSTFTDQDRPQFFYGFQKQPTEGPWNRWWSPPTEDVEPPMEVEDGG